MLEYTVREALRLGLGVDMATGTGWPFGGPWVGEPEASQYITHKKWSLQAGDSLKERIEYIQEPVLRDVFNRYSHLYDQRRSEGEVITSITPDFDWVQIDQRPKLEQLKDPVTQNNNLQKLALDQVRFPKPIPLISLMAYSDQGEVIDLIAHVEEGKLKWVAPTGTWTLYGLFQGWHGKMVERAAPGGEGLVIDHFSQKAIERYLDRFDKAMEEASLDGLRAYFNDSYEVDDARGEANWTMDFLKAFEEKRGYDLQQYVPALWGDDTEENNQRVLSDYRETLSELLLETFTLHWGKWAKDQGKIIRNQAHGSPANILDLYAASDIPETEGTDIIRAKFASSAANVSGKALVSAEAATWLGEHFTTNLADLKENVDRYFVSGVNHIFYHGTCYSPPGETWPGRLFYAAFHANSRNPQWRHFGAFNEYVARTQAVLQASDPNNDLLLYFPMYDRFAKPGQELLDHFHGHGPTLEATEVYADAEWLLEEGYSFDFISDRQVWGLTREGGELRSGNSSYKTLVVPQVTYMPIATLEKMINLAEGGSTIIFHKGLPSSFPGMGKQEQRRREYEEVVGNLTFVKESNGIKKARVGQGTIIIGNEIGNLMDRVGVKREQLVDTGLAYVRKKMGDTTLYMLTNWSGEPVDQWISLNVASDVLLVLDPMTGKQGQAITRNSSEESCQVRVQIPQGASLVIRTHPGEGEAEWRYVEKGKAFVPIEGDWQITFSEGGPELPPLYKMLEPSPWTDQADSVYLNFSGTAVYSVNFPKPSESADAWLLDLGSIHESAHVKLNGQSLGTLIGPTFQIQIPVEAFEESNLLEIEVSNLMANRIADLDRRGVFWKRFYNINVSARTRENLGPAGVFDASQWEVRPSGLEGPVYLIPLFLIKED